MKSYIISIRLESGARTSVTATKGHVEQAHAQDKGYREIPAHSRLNLMQNESSAFEAPCLREKRYHLEVYLKENGLNASDDERHHANGSGLP